MKTFSISLPLPEQVSGGKQAKLRGTKARTNFVIGTYKTDFYE